MKKILALFILAVACHTAQSQAGSLDSSFGQNGLVRTSFPSTARSSGPAFEVIPDAIGRVYVVFFLGGFTAISRHLSDGAIDVSYGQNGYSLPIQITSSAALMQPDGKIVLAGGVIMNGNPDIAVARVNTDGTLDNSFAGDGIQNTDIAMDTEGASDLALQPDGKIVVVGQAAGDFAVVRYNSDGSVDNSFSGDGIELTNFGGPDESARGVAIQPDGKIVVAGNAVAGTNVFGVARYLPDGTPDNSFSFDGKTTILIGNFCFAAAVAMQSDGKIVVAGGAFSAGNPGFALARLNTDGAPDNSFSGDGQLITDLGPFDDRAQAVVIQGDGKIIAGGYTAGLGPSGFALVRYNTDGTPDNTFSGDGVVITDISSSLDLLFSLALMADGRIVAGGYASSQYAVVRYLSNGMPDNSFDGDGIVTGGFPDGTTAYQASAVQSDGKIVVAGSAFIDDRSAFAIARYNTDGSLDNSFSDDGLQVVTFEINGFNIANAVTILADGKIVVAGSASNGSNADFGIARLNPDGSPDNSFSGDGKVLVDLRGEDDFGEDMRIQSDGKIVVAGYSYSGGSQDFALVRLNTDGTLDNSFSGDGKVFTDFAVSEMATAMIIQPDGKIVAVIVTNWQFGNTNIVIARYNTNGELDPSFDFDGKVMTDYAGGADWAGAVALQTDGKILIAGNVTDNSGNDFALARYNANGSLDNSFSGDGMLIFDGGGTYENATSVAIQTNGKILVGGYLVEESGGNFAVLRFNADGTVDNSFSEDGIAVTDFGLGEDIIESLSISGNRVYAAGRTSYYGTFHGALAAYFIEGLCTISATIPNATTLNSGVNANTVYIGYAPASDLTLTVQVSGGTAPYSYVWSNGSTSSSITVMPVVATTYTVTVTDANGCITTASRLVNVIDVRCGNKLDKVLVCNVPPGYPANSSTNCVAANAVDEMLRKGSYLGNCTLQNLVTSKAMQPGLNLIASPNPTRSSFTLDIRSSNYERAELIVWDATGKLVERINVLPNSIIKLGAAYKQGVYMIELRQGDEKVNMKLLKIE